jgi:hypothetical protein
MTENPLETAPPETPMAPQESQPAGPQKPWRHDALLKLTDGMRDGLYPVYFKLTKEAREHVGLMMKIPVFIKDPLLAQENPTLGVQEISVRFEENMGDGPTSSRVAVVDFNADMQTLDKPVAWDPVQGWFHKPEDKNAWLPDPPKVPKNINDPKKVKDAEKYREKYQQFIDKTLKNPYFHQVNAWAVVQRVLEFYQEPSALGRPVPWGFDGNRLLIVPHAGFGENAFYDNRSKSLQFYYFGDQQSPSYTCLSHDIIAHETGHAILDGVRPMYNQLSSLQTAAFHEFIGDLTAIVLALFNDDVRRFVNTKSEVLKDAKVVADLAKQFSVEVEGRDYLRTAFNELKMDDPEIENSLTPHTVSQVLTGAMWEILTMIADKHMAKNDEGQKVSPGQALWWAVDRFRRVALQPLDLCPPCDIQLIDYAKAVIHNDILTNPVDEQGYRPAMLEIFHNRKLCTCAYQADKVITGDCAFYDVMQKEKIKFIYHDIEGLSRSRTAAYYFLSDNRKVLHIPLHQDVRVVDLYDTNKYNAAAERQPREIVLEYAWQEEVVLENNPQEKLDFGKWNGKSCNIDCGGTLVFDESGNLLSWFRKPGTEHISPQQEQDILQAKKQTKVEQGLLDDLKIGRQRKKALLSYLAANIQRGLVGVTPPENRFSEGARPITAFDQNGVLHFEMAPHLRMSNLDEKEDGWLVNY